MTPQPRCPRCRSEKLTFVEHAISVTVYRCDDCKVVVAISNPPKG